MNDEAVNDIWETVLKVAVEEYTLEMNKEYLFDDEINHIALPTNYKLKMYKFILQYRLKRNLKIILKQSRKIASIILLIMGITFIYLLQFDNVRAACKNVIINVYEKFIRLDFISSTDDLNDEKLNVKFIPDSYQLKELNSGNRKTYLKYEDTEGKVIELTCYFQSRAFQLDNEKHTVRYVQINNDKGQFFEANDKISNNYLVWHTDRGSFVLSACLEQQQMIKIAENIK